MIPSPRALRAFVAAHWLFLVLLAAGAALRVVTMLGYRWVMWFPDSFEYLKGALHPQPSPARPAGYSFVLWMLGPFKSVELVIVLQHLLGLGIAVAIYVLLNKRFGVPWWGASLAAAPALLDAYTIQLEHMLMSDTLFIALLMGAVTLVLWKKVPGPGAAAGAGLLLAMATLTRSVGLPLVILLLGYLVVRRAGWRAVGVALVAAAVPLALYAAWFQSFHHKYALTNSSGIFLYARAMTFADCDEFEPTIQQLPMCPILPPEKRPANHYYVWNSEAVLRSSPDLPPWFSKEQEKVAGDFGKRAIMGQPKAYFQAVWDELSLNWEWERPVFPDKNTYDYYEFGKREEPLPNFTPIKVTQYDPGRAETDIVEPYAGFMRDYQDHVYLRGRLLTGILAVGLVAVVMSWRRWGGPALLPFSAALAMTVLPPMTVMFDYRYQPPVIPLACLAAALAFPLSTRRAEKDGRIRPKEPARVPDLSRR